MSTGPEHCSAAGKVTVGLASHVVTRYRFCDGKGRKAKDGR